MTGILEMRRIEARILKHVFDTMCARLGEDVARSILEETVRQAAVAQGREFAAQAEGEPDLLDFMGILPLWMKDGALEIDVIESSADRLDFNVTRCRYAEMYREMGLGSIGDLLSCNRDGEFCVGYNKKIRFSRTQTIMKGASHCDFRYRLDTGKAGAEDGDA